MSTAPAMPKLKPNEVYCWICKKVVQLNNLSRHNQDHRRISGAKVGN